MPASMAAKLFMNGDPLGFAQHCPDDERGCVANVFYAKVDEIGLSGRRASGQDPGPRYGARDRPLAAGAQCSFASWLMHGLWSPDDLKFMNWSYLLFTPRQSDQLRAELVFCGVRRWKSV